MENIIISDKLFKLCKKKHIIDKSVINNNITQSQLHNFLMNEHDTYIEIKLNESFFKSLYEKSHNEKCLKYRWTIYWNIKDKDYIYPSVSSKKTYNKYTDALEDALINGLQNIIIV